MVNVFYFISLLTPFLTDLINILGEKFPFPSPLKMLKGENKQSFMLWNFSFLFIFVAHGQKVIEIPSENQYTTQVLYRLGFRWSPTSWNYVDQMLTAIAGFGFFE